MLRTQNFSTESLRTQDSENVVGLGDRASDSKLQRLKGRSKTGIVMVNQRCQRWKSLHQFWSDRFETNRTWGPNILKPHLRHDKSQNEGQRRPPSKQTRQYFRIFLFLTKSNLHIIFQAGYFSQPDTALWKILSVEGCWSKYGHWANSSFAVKWHW